MMPLAPHMSPPSADGTDTTTTTSALMPNKPKLAFSIDSIVNSKADKDLHNSRKHRLSPTLPEGHRLHKISRTSRSSSESPPPIAQSPALSNHSTPVNSPSPPQPLLPLRLNGCPPAPGDHHQHHPYHALPIHPQAIGPQSIGQSPTHSLSHHPLMMAAMANHMSVGAPIPQQHSYHQAMAMMANPWLMRAHPLAAMNRFHGMPFDGAFLLPPFRKPKRVRTAFSPGQLLKLEQAFEKNHYVVGSERKQLATGLGLSETQVKVWFQNRRTKHKRQKQEGDSSPGHTGAEGDGSGDEEELEADMDGEADEDEEVDVSDDSESAGSQRLLMGAQTPLWPYHLMGGTGSSMASTSNTRYQ